MPRDVARMLAVDQSVETIALEAALDFLLEKSIRASRAGEPADFVTRRNIMIISLTIDLRLRNAELG